MVLAPLSLNPFDWKHIYLHSHCSTYRHCATVLNSHPLAASLHLYPTINHRSGSVYRTLRYWPDSCGGKSPSSCWSTAGQECQHFNICIKCVCWNDFSTLFFFISVYLLWVHVKRIFKLKFLKNLISQKSFYF